MDIFVILIQSTILYAIPLMVVGLGGVFSERSGIINLALEGEMIFGAFIGAIFTKLIVQANPSLATSQWLYILGMLISAASGSLFSLLLSFSAIKFKADQTIGGTALNMLAPAIVCTFGLLIFSSEKVVSNANFVIISSSYGPGMQSAMENDFFGPILKILFDKMFISTYICIAIFVVLTLWLYNSKIGTHLRACGEHPQAADSVGINVFRMRYLGTSIGGALAGLGGFVYIATCAATTAESGVAGLGFLALAIMIFGNWNPLFISLGAILFGFLKCLGVLYMQIPFLKALGLPLYFYNIVPYVVVLIVLIITRKKSGCPKAEGIPYDKGAR